MADRSFEVARLPGFATIAITAFVILYLPIITLVAFSFNAGKSVAVWQGFSLHWYADAWANEDVKSATLRSLIIAVSASAIATTVATMAALGTTRRRQFKGQTFIYVAINQPLMVPEIVTAVALLIFFGIVKTWTGYQGLGYLIAAHAAFCIPFAYLPIRARLEGMDLSLETAAADLYATPDAFGYVPPWALAWGYRRQNLVRELIAANADILCLQEVQSTHFADFLAPELHRAGYAGVYKKKTSEVLEASRPLAIQSPMVDTR